jgi:hypothetical protein
MICGNCQNETTRIKVINGHEICSNCSNLKENRCTDDLMTRNRVRIDSLKFEGDTLPPQKYDKHSKRIVPNEDFLKLNGSRAKNFFKKDDLESAGYSKLAYNIEKTVKEEKQLAAKTKSEVEFHGDAKQRVKELLETD